jgi:hypothetical protein
MRARPLSVAKLAIAKKEYEMLENMGIVRRSTSSWASPLHMVPKANGEWRPCGNYRALNNITKADKYPVPNIHTFTQRLEGLEIFSKIDLVKAYHQIPMLESDIPKTAIITPFGLFEYLRMPFGLKNAGATFQRFIDDVTKDMPFVFAFVDDLIVGSKSKNEHDGHLKIIFNRFIEKGIKISAPKCKFYQDELTFLGFHISKEGIKPSKEKTDVLQKMPAPKDFKELRSVLGMFGFYQKFIPDYANIVAPLRDLDEDYHWDDTHETAFDLLKENLINATCLAFPSAEAESYTVTTDASNVAIGACLHQIVNGKSSPIDFMSRKLSKAERNYSAFDRELLAIVAAVKKWKHYISGMNTTIFTDHKPIVGAYHSKAERKSDRQQRHFSVISEYVTDIMYIAGKDNVVADKLSRISAVQIDVFDMKELANHQTSDLKEEFSSELKAYELPGEVKIWCDTSTGFPRPIVPEKFRFCIFEDLHDISHPGCKSTMKIIKDRFVWPRMEKDIKQWCSECDSCQRAKIHRHTKSSRVQFQEPTDRFHTVHIDIVGPLPTSHEGYNYVLTMIDRSTRWLEAMPIKSITAEEVARAFVFSWISRFGVPMYLITDRGTQFESDLFKHLSDIIGFQRLRTTAYHPMTNGLLERMHRTMKNSLRCKLKDTHEWLNSLPVILLGLRNTPASNNLTPFNMVTGASILMPNHAITGNTKRTNYSYINQLSSLLKTQFVVPRFSQNSSDKKVYVNPALKECKRVWIRKDRILKPLEVPYEGPMEVISRNDKYFTLKRLDGKNDTVSIDRLKPYQENTENQEKNKDTEVISEEACNTEQVFEIPSKNSGRKVKFNQQPDFFYY